MTRAVWIAMVLAALIAISDRRAFAQRAKADEAARAAGPDTPALGAAAQRHWERGLAHYERRNYEGAIAELRDGYAIEAHPWFLFAWAQAERLRGSCARAIDPYRRFLATNPPADKAARAREHLIRCESMLPEPWYADTLGHVLVGTGAGSLLVGGILLIRADSAEDSARSADDYAEFAASIERARRDRTIGVSGLVVGALLATAGVVRYLSYDRAEVSVASDGTRTSLVVTRHF